jgi:hypothetical protein
MYFRSWRFLLLAKILIVIGGVLLFFGWTYADAAKREATTVGTISGVINGKGSTYQYSFKVNGVTIHDDTGTCRTDFTPQGCQQGAQVLVHYDRDHISRSMLEDFGAASRQRLFIGGWMVCCGGLLIGLYFVFNRKESGPKEPE